MDAKPYVASPHNCNTPNRRALTDLPANVVVQQQGPAFLRKALPGSPLKRSFTAAMEGNDGLRYFKRRRLGEEETLSHVHEAEQSFGQTSGSFRPVLSPTADDEVSVDQSDHATLTLTCE